MARALRPETARATSEYLSTAISKGVSDTVNGGDTPGRHAALPVVAAKSRRTLRSLWSAHAKLELTITSSNLRPWPARRASHYHILAGTTRPVSLGLDA
jgi:hypothetical protein